jgi:hypothetical protein
MERVVNTAYAFGFWVFGGYIRDVIVRGESEFGDIDIGISSEDEDLIGTFIRVLAVHHKVEERCEISHVTYMPSKCLRRIIKLTVDGTAVDLCVFDSRHAWRQEQSCDFTCNLFYQTAQTHLALRHIPDLIQNHPNPVKHLMELTRQKKFEFLGRPDKRLCARALRLTDKGWDDLTTTTTADM